jgi:hypothetical protein
MTVLSLLPALILWEEKEASSVPVTLDTLEMALHATILMSAQLICTTVQTRLHVQILKVVLAALATLDTLEMVETATILMSAVLVLIAVHSRQHVLTLMAVSFVPVILDTLAMELDALMLMSVN